MRTSYKRHQSIFVRSQLSLLVRLLLIILPTTNGSINQDGFGYKVTTNVDNILNLAYDIRDMRSAGNDHVTKMDIYLNGKNAIPLTLSNLSTNSSSMWGRHAIYNVYRDAFAEIGQNLEGDSTGMFDKAPVEQYANTMVLDVFDLDLAFIESEAVLAYNVMMAFWGSLFDMLAACKRNDDTTKLDMNLALDTAAAYWVGAGQIKGNSEVGDFLYNLAEIAGDYFGQDTADVTAVNADVIAMFNVLQSHINTKNTCASGEQGYLTVRQSVKVLIGFSNTMLVQMLLHQVQESVNVGSDFVELYSLAILPQISACDPNLANNLLELTVIRDVTSDTMSRTIALIQKGFSCLGITCGDVGSYKTNKIPQCVDQPLKVLANYTMTEDVTDRAYIDRDVKQLEITMKYGAYEAALDLYRYGWNTAITMKSLALNQFSGGPANEYVAMQNYYANSPGDLPDNIIEGVLSGKSPYAIASGDQKSAIVSSTLQGSILYYAVLNEFESALTICDSNGGQTDIMKHWDGGAAFFIGSIEGPSIGGQPYGLLLYALGKNLCAAFGTCEPDDALIDKKLLFYIQKASAYLKSSQCQQARTLFENLKSELWVPLIQASLYHATQAASNAASPSTGSLYGYTRALLPPINDIKPQSALTIQKNSAFTSAPISDGIDVFFGAFQAFLGSNCGEIGVLQTTSGIHGVCSGSLVDSNYIATTDVSNIARLALDIAAIKNDTSVNNRISIYSNGKNAQGLTLASLSLKSAEKWNAYPMYVIYKYAFYDIGLNAEGDSPGDFDGAPVEYYADTLVKDLFSYDNSDLEAAAALCFNVLMACWGSLYDMMAACQRNDTNTVGDMHNSLDSAAAYYFGTRVAKDGSTGGYALYDLTDEIGPEYPASRINKAITESFNYLQADINKNTCANDGGYLIVRKKVKTLISFTNVALMQWLLYHVNRSDQEPTKQYYELFSLALIPQISVCDPASSNDLYGLAVQHKIGTAQRPEVIKILHQSLSCIGITCADLGGNCTSSSASALVHLADYTPSVDVRLKSYIDRDLEQIKVFMKFDAYDAAKDYYEYGWNTYFTLKELATNQFSSGSSVDFSDFEAYYDETNLSFIDQKIEEVLNKSPPFDQASGEQREAVVVGLLKTVVMYLSSMAEFDAAVDACDNGDDITAVLLSWDGGVAFYIGSAEGPNATVREGGQLLYNVANSFCQEFGTCDKNDEAKINTRLVESFSTGSTWLKSRNCGNARNILNTEIKPGIFVPLIQGFLAYGVLDAADGATAASGYLYAFSRAILPGISRVDPYSASVIYDNSGFSSTTSAVVDGIDSIFAAIYNVLGLLKISCQDIGVLTTGTVQGSTKLDMCDESTFGVTQTPVVIPTTPTPVAAPSTDPPIVNPGQDPAGLAWGRYHFVDKALAENDAGFSLDVKDMYNAASVSEAKQVYVNGTHVPGGLSGNVGIKSLRQFSTDASNIMAQDPMYNFFRFAFYSDSSFENAASTAQNWPFGDAVVNLALSPSNGNDPKLGAKSAVVMNCWMMIVHRVYEAVRKCQEGSDGAALSIDSAVALWIGWEQGQGIYNSGYMMYSQAQDAARLYGNAEKEAPVNTNLMNKFVHAQSIAKECSLDSHKFQDLRVAVQDIIRALSIPLLQQLLVNLSRKATNQIQLYALAFIPQAVACNNGEYDYLKGRLYQSSVDVSPDDEKIRSDLGGVLRCLRITCDDLGDISTASSALRNLVSSICTQMEVDYDPKYLAGYETTSDVSELARIDLDVHQINLLMKTEAYDAAMTIYEYGSNSFDSNGTLRNLKSMATESFRQNAGNVYDMYQAYFKSSSHGNDIVSSILAKKTTSIYTGASRLQLAEAVFRSLQTKVTYMQLVAKLRTGVEACRQNSTDAMEIDEAVALFVGSMEGSQSGGLSDFSGAMMMALAKETCQAFGKCETHGDATSNELVMFAFSDIKQYLYSGDCDSAATTIDAVILPTLTIPIIQETLNYVFLNQGLPTQSTNASLATLAEVADSVLPYVAAVNQTVATAINAITSFDPSRSHSANDATTVAALFAQIMRGIGVDCMDVGTHFSGLTVCNGTSIAPDVGTPTKLGGDLYVTTTYVKDRAGIALDIKKMENELKIGKKDTAQEIYVEGENSPIYNDKGIMIDQRTLASFSINASSNMKENPLFQISVYALQDSNGQYLGADAGRFADTIVKHAFEVGGQTTLAAEAAVALNLWMELANELFETIELCKKNYIADNDGVHSIDEAVAYWIGDDQQAGDSSNGFLLYALAERMGDIFHNSDASGQARANVNIIRLFNQAKIELSYPDACSSHQATIPRLQQIVNRITAQMIAVNMQALINYLYENDRQRVRIYSHAIVPLVAGCNPKTFQYLKTSLVDDTYRTIDVGNIIRALQSTLPCFGLQCDDIGVHPSEKKTTCQDPAPLTSLSGYRPSSDAYTVSQIDLDILELDILMQMKAYRAAEQLYLYGKHARTGASNGGSTVSLASLASSTGRSVVPEFDSFKRYYGGNDKYVDTIIGPAFDQNSTLSDIERRFIATGTSQYMIVQMAALEALHDAVGACDDAAQPASSLAAQNWSDAAAYIIGSLEGTTPAGSDEGLLVWALAKKYCVEFGTCSLEVPDSARVNDKIKDLLYLGRGAIQGGSCDALRKATAQLKPLLNVALIQASLSTAIALVELRHDDAQKDMLRAQAYTYTLALLPLIADSNLGSAETIANNFNISNAPIQSGVIKVSQAFFKVLGDMNVDCKDIGQSDEIDACAAQVTNSRVDNIGLIIGVIVGTFAMASICWLIFAKRRKNLENPPEFVQPKGELNHISDTLLPKHDESDIMGPSETELLNEYNDADAVSDDDPTETRAPDDSDSDDGFTNTSVGSLLRALRIV